MDTTSLEQRSREILGHLYDVAGVGMCVTDRERRFVAVNREYCETYGYEPAELLGNEFTMVVPQEQKEAAAKLHDEFLGEEGGEVSGEWRVVGKDGSIRSVLVTAGRLTLKGQLFKVTTVYDMKGRSLQAHSEWDRRNALREVNHRVKNHLASLQSMLSLELRRAERENNVVDVLTASINRIKSMSQLYDRLQHAPEVNGISLHDYLHGLISDVLSTGGRGDQVESRVDVEDLQLTVEQATSLGLILNELITNSLKHAISSDETGWISVTVKSTGSYIEARVADSGAGLPPDYLERGSANLGLQIVEAVVGRHDGEFILEEPGSSRFLVRLPRMVDRE